MKLPQPIPVLNVDGTNNANGTITHYTWRSFTLGRKRLTARMLVTSLGKEDIILGLPWLQKHNPSIDWKAKTLAIQTIKGAMLKQEKPDTPNYDSDTTLVTTQGKMVQKVTTATTLAQQVAKPKGDPKDLVPTVYHHFLSLFEKGAASRLPEHRPYDHAINLKPDFRPRDCKTYPLTPREEAALTEFLTENLAKRYIRPSKSPMASPFFFVDKKDILDLRPCQDYRELNEGTVKDSYPFPLISDLMDKLKGAKYFTKLDLRSGYNNVRIREGDEWKAAFKTSKGLFEPLVMFFGMCNSPATFQRFMDDIFRIEIIDGCLVIYMDDILIFAATLEQLREKTFRVLQILKDNDLFLKPEKCVFETQQVEFLGMIVTPNQLHMDPAKLSGIQTWPTPSTVKQLRSFLGFCNFYRRFIPQYSHLTNPLHALTKITTKWEWTPERQQAFSKLKELFAEQPALLIPDPSKPFILETDASKVATGAVLYQSNSNGDLQPCGFVSEALGPAQQRYEVYDRELLGIVRGLTAWRHYLLGSPHQVTIWCDHKNLSYFRAARRLTPRQSRWNLVLSQYNKIITHKPGKSIPGADLLSRRSDHGVEPDETRILLPDSVIINNLHIDELKTRIANLQETDGLAQLVRQAKEKKLPAPAHITLDDWTMDKETGILSFRKKIYVPENKEIKQQILKLSHDLPTRGHPGVFKTTYIVRQSYWWPGLTIFVKNFIAGCAQCQQMKINTHPTRPPLNPIAADPNALPFQAVSMDFITDLPESHGYDSIMVIVDHDASKGIVLIPCHKTIDALQTAQLYHQHVYRRFGLPTSIISDRGPQFASKVFQTLCSRLGIKSKMSTAYHPQSDGQTERANQEIEAYLRIYCASQPQNWVDSLADIEFVHNSQVHSVTKATPFHIIQGFTPRAIPEILTQTDIPSLSQRLRSLTEIRREALAAHELARMHMARHTTRGFKPFKQGDKVWLEATNLRTPNQSKKMTPKREGPFSIEKVISPLTYQLSIPNTWRIHPVFHASLLTPFIQNDSHGPSFSHPPPEIIDNEEEFEVEAILSHRGNGKRRRYLVKWVGYESSENQWVDDEALTNSQELLSEYKKAKNLK